MVLRKKSSEGAGPKKFQVDLPRRVFRRLRRSVPAVAGQPDKDELLARMRRFDMFARLPPRALGGMLAAATVRVYRTGEYLWHRDEAARYVAFVESGFVKAARKTKEGSARTYGLFGPGDSLGVFAIWSDMKYPTDAIAMNDGLTAICVEARAMMNFAEKYPRLSTPLRREMTRFTDAFINKIEVVSAGTVPQRLAVLMAQLVDRYGVEKKGTHARLPMGLTLEQMSDIVGARLETVARTLGDWKRAGWLYIDASGVHFSRLDLVRKLLPS